jgi:hypothetical protein
VATHVVSVAAVRTLSIKSLEFAASVSVKWRTVVNFQVLQRLLGNNDGVIIITGASRLKLQRRKSKQIAWILFRERP